MRKAVHYVSTVFAVYAVLTDTTCKIIAAVIVLGTLVYTKIRRQR